MDRDLPYAVAFLDWLACATAGASQRAARAVRATGDDLLSTVAYVATAGHVLDFDDTFEAGVAHVSAAAAPAALVVAAHRGLSLAAMLNAYAEGFEAMAAVAAASHPSLYEAGWHPTAVFGPVGAAVAASRLFDLSAERRRTAVAIALLRAGGTRGAFGSDGKAIQVGLAAAAGVQAALLARAGASVDPEAIRGPLGLHGVLGGRWAEPGLERAIDGNWIKLYPSCLGTHSPIEAAVRARAAGHRLDRERVDVRVHPVGRQAAHVEAVSDGLSAKFSIPYCVAYTFCHSPPGVRDFAALDPVAVQRSRHVNVTLDESLPQFGAVLTMSDRELARIPFPRGAPQRPAAAADLADKLAQLAGERLDGILDDPAGPAAAALDAAGFSGARGS